MTDVPQTPQIIALTDEWCVVDKPAHWLCIPARRQEDTTPVLKTFLEEKVQQKIWTVHRIDRETSGVVLFARTAEAHKKANAFFEKRQVQKHYLAIAHGIAPFPTFTIRTPIDNKTALTQVEVLKQHEVCFLLRAQILTGRHHQIRIHMSREGHPLLGDHQYVGLKPIPTEASFPQVALHAESLQLPEGEVYKASVPEDFKPWM